MKGVISGREVKSVEMKWGAVSVISDTVISTADTLSSRWRLAEGSVLAPSAPETFAAAGCSVPVGATAVAEALPPVGASALLAGGGDRRLLRGIERRGAGEVGIPSEDTSLSEKPPAPRTTPFFFFLAVVPVFDAEPTMASSTFALVMS